MTELCRVFWRSHGCDLPRFHDGDSHSHVCGPCPPDCDAPIDSDWADGGLDDCSGSCSVHCGDRPTHTDVFYGEDADHFPQRAGIPGLRLIKKVNMTASEKRMDGVVPPSGVLFDPLKEHDDEPEVTLNESPERPPKTHVVELSDGTLMPINLVADCGVITGTFEMTAAMSNSYRAQGPHEALSKVVYEMAKLIEERNMAISPRSDGYAKDEGDLYEKLMTMVATAPLSQEYAARLAFGK